jgi:hypothetical protein
MKRLLAGVAVAAAGVAATAVVAEGQGTGGTVGPRAQGTLQFNIIVDGRHAGDNFATGHKPNRKKPFAVADFAADSGRIELGGNVVGRAFHTQAATFVPKGKRYRGGAVFVYTDAYQFGNGDNLFISCIAEDTPTPNNCAVTGGTGGFAGARGTEVENAPTEGPTKKSVRLPMTITFIP